MVLAGPSIIPQPQKVEMGEGVFELRDGAVIAADSASKEAAQWLGQQLEKSTGFKINEGLPSHAQIRLEVVKGKMGHEAYALKVEKDVIRIVGGGKTGVFYGCQSLLQLFPTEIYSDSVETEVKWQTPAVVVRDSPKYQWRGFMVDLSRHYLSIDLLKDYIDWMAMHKLNRFHLHLTDSPAWRVEIKGYPKLTTIGAVGSRSKPEAPAQFYTQAELKDLVAYAKSRYVILVPEIDVPGHFAAAARAYPELDGGAQTLNVTAPATEKFLDAVFTQMHEVFDTPYFHHGSDEVRGHAWHKRPDMKAAMDKMKMKNQHELEGWFNRKVAKDLLERGMQPIAWDEASDFGVDKRAIVQWWRCLHPEALVTALQRGYKTIISPADFIYFDYPYVKGEFGGTWEGMRNGGNSTELIYNWQPVPKEISSKEASNIIGLEACLWTEFIADRKRAEFMTFPRMAAYAEQAWGRKDAQSFEAFSKKLEIQIDRYKQLGINYRIPRLRKSERQKLQPEGFKL